MIVKVAVGTSLVFMFQRDTVQRPSASVVVFCSSILQPYDTDVTWTGADARGRRV